MSDYSEPCKLSRIWLLANIFDTIYVVLNQCHLVSDKVGNFHGNKALVTFL